MAPLPSMRSSFVDHAVVARNQPVPDAKRMLGDGHDLPGFTPAARPRCRRWAPVAAATSSGAPTDVDPTIADAAEDGSPAHTDGTEDAPQA